MIRQQLLSQTKKGNVLKLKSGVFKVILGIILLLVILGGYQFLGKLLIHNHLSKSERIELLELEKETVYSEKDIRLGIISKAYQTAEPYELSSLIVSEMMNFETINRANEYKKSKKPLEAIEKWEFFNFAHREDIGPDHPYETTQLIYSYDTMKLFKKFNGISVGQCYDFGIYNMAVLRLIGVRSDQGFVLGVNTHVYNLFNLDVEDYLLSNFYMYKYLGEGNFEAILRNKAPISLKDQDFYNVAMIANDTLYYPAKIKSSVYSNNYLNQYQQHVSFPKDDIPKLNEKISSLNFDENSVLDPYSVIKSIYHLSQVNPDSQYTQAKYASQSLLVRYPNLYLRAFAELNLIPLVITEHQLTDTADVLKYLNESITTIESLHEDTKCFSPFQIEVNKEATVIDKALYASILLEKLEISSDVVIATEDAYIYLRDQNQLISTTSFEMAEEISGEIVMIFNDENVYYPELNINNYDENNGIMETINAK